MRKPHTSARQRFSQVVGRRLLVADQGGNLIAHIRMDGAPFGTIDISINKAFTSSACEISTRDLATHSQPGQPFFGIHASNHGRIMIFAGGIPLKRDGKVAGAIGSERGIRRSRSGRC
jgi:uncharacterized protein GlcG (DUF336 family)